MTGSRGRVLIVAGSDSGGGAGIQADIKTVTVLGGFAATAITALTAQNTLGVSGILPIPPDFVRAQMAAVLDDIGADCLKTGMLYDAGLIEAVAEALPPSLPLVVDPVLVATSGARLLQPSAVDALRERLLPRATVITPNLPEAEVLLDRAIPDADAMLAAAEALRERHGCAVLLKGGHLAGETVFDVLIEPGGRRHEFSSPRIHTRNTHGTGCTLAAAVATGLAQGLGLVEAVARARHYVRRAIETAPGLGGGHGPLNHGHAVPPYRWD